VRPAASPYHQVKLMSQTPISAPTLGGNLKCSTWPSPKSMFSYRLPLKLCQMMLWPGRRAKSKSLLGFRIGIRCPLPFAAVRSSGRQAQRDAISSIQHPDFILTNFDLKSSHVLCCLGFSRFRLHAPNGVLTPYQVNTPMGNSIARTVIPGMHKLLLRRMISPGCFFISDCQTEHHHRSP
jgi:hypothetical protein